MCHYYGREAGLELREDIGIVLAPNMVVVSMEPMVMLPEGLEGVGSAKSPPWGEMDFRVDLVAVLVGFALVSDMGGRRDIHVNAGQGIPGLMPPAAAQISPAVDFPGHDGLFPGQKGVEVASQSFVGGKNCFSGFEPLSLSS